MRIDALVSERLNVSRTKAARLVREGRVFYDETQVVKPSKEVDGTGALRIEQGSDFASVGGEKLQKALDDFGTSVKGAVCADIGASNGGFCDCLLRAGAAKVYAVDVGECALPPRLREDERIIVKDRLNARFITPDEIGEPCDVVTIDVSFISLKYILPPIKELLAPRGVVYALIKPQFEAGRAALSKRGIVTSPKAREAVVEDMIAFAKSLGLQKSAITTAPIKKDKNIEYVVLLQNSQI